MHFFASSLYILDSTGKRQLYYIDTKHDSATMKMNKLIDFSEIKYIIVTLLYKIHTLSYNINKHYYIYINIKINSFKSRGWAISGRTAKKRTHAMCVQRNHILPNHNHYNNHFSG